MTVGLFKCGLRTAIRSPMFSAFAALLDAFADTRNNLLRVLTYHRIEDSAAKSASNPVTLSATPDEFCRQMKYLAAHCRVVSLQDVLACVESESNLPPRSVLITFDDAYRDFLKCVWPVLSKLKLPSTLFVPTSFPDNPGQSFWWDRLYRCTHGNGSLKKLVTPIGELPLELQRGRALAFLTRYYESTPTEEAEAFLDEVSERASTEKAGNDVLSWNELRQLAADGVALGAHTQTHPLLNRTSLSRAKREIIGSVEDLRRKIGTAPLAFAYPGGALTNDVANIIGDTGIRLAFTTCRGVNDLCGFDPLRIRRINIGQATSLSLLRVEMRPGFRFLNSLWTQPAASRD